MEKVGSAGRRNSGMNNNGGRGMQKQVVHMTTNNKEL